MISRKAAGRRVFFLAVVAWSFLPVPPALSLEIIDRVAATIDRQVLTVSEIDQMVTIRFFPRREGVSDDEHRREVLEALIAQALRFRDVERFGAQEIPKDSIEARMKEIEGRFPSAEAFADAMRRAELTPDEVRALVKRQLQVEAHIEAIFAPVVVVLSDEIEAYYRGPWREQRRERGLPVPPLAEVREEIRALLKSSRLQQEIETWTAQLRARANVDVFAWR